MKLVGALWLVLCGLLTAAQIPLWRSDQALWGYAAHVNPENARPAVNYALALLKHDQRAGMIWLMRAGELAEGHPREHEIRAVVRHHLRWMEAFGANVCSRPSVQPHC